MFWYNVAMKEQEPKQEQESFDFDEAERPASKRRMGPLGFVVLGLALLLIGAGAAAVSTRGLPTWPTRMTQAMAEPDTPAPVASPTPAVAQTAAPSETAAQDVQAGAEFERTAFVVDGVAIGVLASEEAAEAAEQEAIAWFELQVLGSGTLETTVENEISFAPARDYPEAADMTLDAIFALLTGPDTPLSVRSTLTEETISYTPHESVTEKDDTLLAGTRIILRYGTDGETHTVTTRTFLNGVAEGDAQTVTITAREPVDALIRVGTQEVDPEAEPGKREGERGMDAGELTFASPTEEGDIASNYGQRAGVLHLGLDYSGALGDAVYASCGGIVVSAIERGGYGLMVEIDHGDGFVTRYAHLDSISVAIGDVVAQGDAIGTLGSSGNCSTPHLHFELRIDGIAYNPRYYLD